MPAGRRGRKVLPRAPVDASTGTKDGTATAARQLGARGSSAGADRIAPSQWRQDNQEMFKRSDWNSNVEIIEED